MTPNVGILVSILTFLYYLKYSIVVFHSVLCIFHYNLNYVVCGFQGQGFKVKFLVCQSEHRRIVLVCQCVNTPSFYYDVKCWYSRSTAVDSKSYHIFDILDIENFRIDIFIMYVWCLQIEKKKGHTNVCFTFIFKVKYRVHVIYVEIYEIRTKENIKIDTKIKFIACNHPEWSKVIQ